jgi:hypothetical protein
MTVNEGSAMTDASSETTNGNLREPLTATNGSRAGGGGPFNLSAQQKKVLLVVLVIHAILARFTLRDLRHRPASAVRGPKRVWRVWASMNTTGSIAYWLVGRRRGDIDPVG